MTSTDLLTRDAAQTPPTYKPFLKANGKLPKSPRPEEMGISPHDTDNLIGLRKDPVTITVKIKKKKE